MAFPDTYLDVSVEAVLGADLTGSPFDWVWTDVTEYVRANGIRVTRGGFDGSIQSPPSRCDFYVDNRDGRWSPTNPGGAWYGQIGKGTPVRVVTGETGTSVRWTGFFTELPPRWNTKETDRFVPVVASGILRRLERGSTPLRSALVRAIAQATTRPVAYWPGEDGSQAATIAEHFGGPAMTWVNTLTPASDNPDGSAPLPEFTTDAGVSGTVPTHVPSGSWTVMSVLNFPASPPSATVLMRWHTGGTYPMWQITLTPGSPDALALEAYDTAGALQVNHALSFAIGSNSEPFGQWVILVANATPNGANLEYRYGIYDATGGSGSSTGSASGATAGAVLKVVVPASAKLNGMAAGHWTVWNADVDISLDTNILSALNGHTGDSVVSRVIGLGDEEGVPVEWDSGSSITMGPQGTDTFLTLLREAEAASGGRLFENRNPAAGDFYLYLKHAGDLSNQDAALTLNHDSGHLSPPFEPTDDDQQLRNDWTATRSGSSGIGSSARVVADSGNLTPAKVGTYGDSVSVNVESDEDLIHQAGWRVNIGTHEGLRFPLLTLDFARNPGLIADWITCDIGSRVTITNPPEGIAPDDVDLLIEGWTEVFGPKTWQVALNCSPYGPWHVFQIADTSGDTDPYLGRLAGDEKAALRTALDSTTTGAVNFDPNFYRWTDAADDFPLDITLKPTGAPGNGEVVTLSGISTSAATYVAAGAASHADNAAVTPALYAGSGIRQLILILAAIRSSGTGTLVTPTDYTRLPVFAATDNVQLFGKIDGGSESNPTVTPSGGSAGDTVSAFTFGFTVMPVSLEDLSDIVLDSVAQLNASAQNISYGGLFQWRLAGSVQLILGWKQDDYTSVAVPSGFTEILEASSTTGSDQSLYAAYRIDTTPAVVNGGSLVVTGGASAISRSAVVAIAGGIQVMTISARSVNGVVASHSAGARIAVADPAVLAL